MMDTDTILTDRAALSTFRLPPLTFAATSLPDPLGRLWTRLRDGRTHAALRLGRDLVQSELPEASILRAGLHFGLACAEWLVGSAHEAERQLEASLEAHAVQWSSHRLRLDLFFARQAFVEAYDYAVEAAPPDARLCPAWDEQLTASEWHLAAASFAWRLQRWDDVAGRLRAAFPKHVASMPGPLQADWLRLAVYRDDPEEARAAAAAMIAGQPREVTDTILQLLVQQGWTAQALPLYRSAFDADPTDEKMRRRLVGLCIREGAIEEARLLSRQGPLRLAV